MRRAAMHIEYIAHISRAALRLGHTFADDNAVERLYITHGDDAQLLKKAWASACHRFSHFIRCYARRLLSLLRFTIGPLLLASLATL